MRHEFRLEDWVPRVYRFALRLCRDAHVAEDLTQDTFLRAWRQQQRLRDAGALRVWLFRITVNLWQDRLRRGRLPVSMAGQLPDEFLGSAALPDHEPSAREDLAKALAALDALPPRQREVLHMSACEQMTTPEIAEVLGISAEAVKSNLSLARKAMRQQLSDINETV